MLVAEAAAPSPVKAKDALKAIVTEKKKALPTIVTIKPKKRSAPSTESSSKKLQPAKKKQQTKAAASSSKTSPSEPITAKPTVPAGALLLGYSSSSDSDA